MKSLALLVSIAMTFTAAALAQTPAAPSHEHLKVFEPLIDATWRSTAETASGTAIEEYTFEWDAGGAFILFTHSLSLGGNERVQHGMIGWDPDAKKLRFWGFLADGSFFDGHAIEGEDDDIATFEVMFTGSQMERARISIGMPGANVLMYGLTMMRDDSWSQKFERPYQRVVQERRDIAMVNGFNIYRKTVEPRAIVGIRTQCKPDEISATLGGLYAEISGYMARTGAESAGQPLAIYYDYNNENVDFQAALPVDRGVKSEGRIQFGQTPGGEVALIEYSGPYEGIPKAHAAMDIYFEGKGLEASGPPWEVYITDPTTEPDPSKWRTDIFYPVKPKQ